MLRNATTRTTAERPSAAPTTEALSATLAGLCAEADALLAAITAELGLDGEAAVAAVRAAVEADATLVRVVNAGCSVETLAAGLVGTVLEGRRR